MAAEALDLAVSHTKQRVQFGKPLAQQQALRFMMADMQTKLSAARLLVYDAAYRLDSGENADLPASLAKYYSTEAASFIIDRALQLHGGYGYSKAYAIERIYRDIRVNSIYEGSSQVQQMVIAGFLLK
jgi:alkylation response protein AidB-like acyl-CoA dehydrogenase